MKKIVVFMMILLLSLFGMSKKSKFNGVDDWDYNSTIPYDGKKLRKLGQAMPMAAPMKKSIGFSVGGAKDANNFYENLKYDYLPKIDSITYEGVFYDHYFDSQSDSECQNLFCPTYSTALTKNLFTKKDEYYLSVGLDSNLKNIERKKLNIVVVLDISGSMGSPFDKYYYDKNRKVELEDSEQKSSKMQIATKSIANMIDHLKGEDRLGVVLFDSKAYKAKPFRVVRKTDIEAIKRHILDLKERGGTNWSEGYRAGISLFETLDRTLKVPNVYENRIIFITDAMPNRGELSQNGLFGIAKSASKKGIYTTFIGVGVDFNNDLVEAVSKTKGANYYSIHSAKEFKKRLDDEFDYMVTPLVFDLSLKITSNDYKIEAVYGSPDANRATGEVMYVNTLFPTPTNKEGSRGGVILLKLNKIGTGSNLDLLATYTDRSGKSYQISQKAKIDSKPHFDNKSIQKAILLSSYVDLMKNYLIDMRKECNDHVEFPYPTILRHCGVYPPDRPEFAYTKTWERRSCPFKISNGYKKLLSFYRDYFKAQMRDIRDDSLKKELDAIDLILSKKGQKNGNRVDDWSMR